MNSLSNQKTKTALRKQVSVFHCLWLNHLIKMQVVLLLFHELYLRWHTSVALNSTGPWHAVCCFVWVVMSLHRWEDPNCERLMQTVFFIYLHFFFTCSMCRIWQNQDPWTRIYTKKVKMSPKKTNIMLEL